MQSMVLEKSHLHFTMETNNMPSTEALCERDCNTGRPFCFSVAGLNGWKSSVNVGE